MTERERYREYAQRLVVRAIVLLIAYPLSFGPVMWLVQAKQIPVAVVDLYLPLGWGIEACPQQISHALLWYAFLWD